MTNDRKNRAARAEQMRKEREKAERRQRNIISVVIVAVVVVLIGVGAWAVKQAQDENEKETEVIQPEGAIEDFGVPYVPAGGEPAEDAPMVEIFEDFLCPYCKQFEESSGEVLRAQADAGEIQLVYRPFSFLDAMGGSSNEYSQRATNLAICALDEQGPEAFQTVHDALYANQPAEGGSGPSDDELMALAEESGVTVSQECVTQQRFVPWVNAAREHGQNERGVSGTPTVFVNGEEIEDLSGQALADAIEDARQG
ncbi:thioredoxin domain-containing protein [uncultured Aeromicrobium sp.]|uniref:DsbA family protein n=1 Tax=uncultured Aeromicrobium sp. TaxID=337820 RepID=UPI0025DEEC6B|nr:thioredoxin domain-containing protein [uncultured Aeromicrobium sp.]